MKTFSFYTNKIDGVWGYFYVFDENRFTELVNIIGNSALFNSRKLPEYSRTELAAEDLFSETGDGVRFYEWIENQKK
jgi:hypothetical protein